MTDERTEEPTAQLPAKLPLQADDRGILPIIPRDTEEAARYAGALIRAGIVPDSYRAGGKKDGEIDAPLVLAGIFKALEVGLPPQTGLGTIYPVNGRFTVFGDGAIALIQRDRVITKHTANKIGPSFPPDTELGLWPDEYGWEVRYWRRGQEDEPYIGRFTVKDARRAGLWMSSYRKPWIMYPDRMLFNRARAFALRDGFADCLMGLGIREEMEDMMPPPEDGEVGTRHRSALDDEPVTEALPAPAQTEDNPVEPTQAELLDPNF